MQRFHAHHYFVVDGDASEQGPVEDAPFGWFALCSLLTRSRAVRSNGVNPRANTVSGNAPIGSRRREATVLARSESVSPPGRKPSFRGIHRPRHLTQHPVVSVGSRRPEWYEPTPATLIGLSSRINKRRHPNSPLYVAAVRLRGARHRPLAPWQSGGCAILELSLRGRHGCPRLRHEFEVSALEGTLGCTTC